MKRAERAAVMAAGLILLATGVSTLFRKDIQPAHRHHMDAVIELGEYADSSRNLIVGYNYQLLRKFAEDKGLSSRIILSRGPHSYLDSLRRGKADIMVVPMGAASGLDSVLVSIPVDSCCVWLAGHGDHAWMKSVDEWLEKWQQSREHAVQAPLFFNRYNAFRSRRRDALSPYDSLIMKHADTLGWDWRLLAAVVYQESRFHIEARSPRGAEGLMQMVPATAERFGVTDPLDPDRNLHAGACYLRKLQRRFQYVGANPLECCKYTLAAYNAGEGRIDDCINYAASLGVDPSFWSNVVAIIPGMNDDSIMESGIVRIGKFSGVETINYVEQVMSVYYEFCRIRPN